MGINVEKVFDRNDDSKRAINGIEGKDEDVISSNVDDNEPADDDGETNINEWFSKTQPLIDFTNKATKKFCECPGFCVFIDEMIKIQFFVVTVCEDEKIPHKRGLQVI